jgi:hypothetical protein
VTCYNSRRTQSVGKASSPGLDAPGAFFVLGGFMKDPHIVLRQKEQDVARVRQQIHALLTVIPLLKDEQAPFGDVIRKLPLASSGTVTEASDYGMADLELYYPFVRHMHTSGRD